MRGKKTKHNTKDKALIDYFYKTKHTSFFSLLISSGKYKEVCRSKESLVSFITSMASSIIWTKIFNYVNIDEFNEVIRNTTMAIFASLIGLLGFAISGLAILTGTITNKVISKINEDKLITHLINVLYSFYFIGAFIGISIMSFIAMYLMSFPDIVATNFSVIILSFLLSYLFSFSIFYSIALLGTCLRIFLLSYKFTHNDDNKE